LSFALVVLAAGEVKLPEGEGKKVVETACTSCHTLDNVTDKQWDQAKWSKVVKAAALKDDDSARVVAYLTKNFGPDRGKELVEGICTLCHALTRVSARQFTKEEWEGTIKGMIAEGAPVTEEEFALIVNYLTKTYGPIEEGR
jgi:cytochrome c5